MIYKASKEVLLMKNVVITGSTRGIGYALAKEFLNKGCNVTLSGRGAKLSEEVYKELEQYSDKYIYISCNVQEKSSIQNLWDSSINKWGSVDIWINNAGQNVPLLFVWETGESYTDNVIKTNVTGMIYGSQVALNGMLKQGHGAVYNMEGLGSNNMIQLKTILYGTTKCALTYFTKGLAKELKGTGIIAGRLSPGMMLTDFITKSPDGDKSDTLRDDKFKKIFNILGDKPETVAHFFVPKILNNTKNNAHFVWLTNMKAIWRFMTAMSRKDRLIE
jgi:short-subunit dehydrogenase